MIKKRYIFESDDDKILEKIDSKIQEALEEAQEETTYEDGGEYKEEYNSIDMLLDDYAELLTGRDFCFECIRNILQEFSLDLLNEFFDY